MVTGLVRRTSPGLLGDSVGLSSTYVSILSQSIAFLSRTTVLNKSMVSSSWVLAAEKGELLSRSSGRVHSA